MIKCFLYQVVFNKVTRFIESIYTDNQPIDVTLENVVQLNKIYLSTEDQKQVYLIIVFCELDGISFVSRE